VVYADFEAFVRPTGQTHPIRGHKTFDYEEQVPCSVGWKVVSVVPQFDHDYRQLVGENCVERFLKKILKFGEDVKAFMMDPARMVMTNCDKMCFEGAITCHICKRFIDPDSDKKGDKKVRDHDHITGRYLGAAHARCNLRAQLSFRIPVFFHNFRGYDGHFITKALKHFGQEKIGVIGQGMEKYLTLSLNMLVFKDSLMFMGASLQSLAENLLKAGIEHFRLLRTEFATASDEQFGLLLRKGVYPYEYMDSMARFAEQQLPPKEAFFSKLHNSGISDAEYAHAQNVWRKFDMHTMLDYHNLYLKSILFPICVSLLNLDRLLIIHNVPNFHVCLLLMSV